MKISRQSKRAAKERFNACMENGLLSEDRVRKTVSELLDTKPKGYYPTLAHLIRLVRLETLRKTVTVTTAEAIDEGTKQSLTERLNNKFGVGLIYVYQTDPSVIAGMRVQIGSDVFDGTVKGRLNRLQEIF